MPKDRPFNRLVPSARTVANMPIQDWSGFPAKLKQYHPELQQSETELLQIIRTLNNKIEAIQRGK